jgi:hypothetical protein
LFAALVVGVPAATEEERVRPARRRPARRRAPCTVPNEPASTATSRAPAPLPRWPRIDTTPPTASPP